MCEECTPTFFGRSLRPGDKLPWGLGRIKTTSANCLHMMLFIGILQTRGLECRSRIDQGMQSMSSQNSRDKLARNCVISQGNTPVRHNNCWDRRSRSSKTLNRRCSSFSRASSIVSVSELSSGTEAGLASRNAILLCRNRILSARADATMGPRWVRCSVVRPVASLASSSSSPYVGIHCPNR